MKFFKRIKKSNKETLLEIADFIPDHYKQEEQFLNFQEFLENNEWGLALESLIDLADESGHFFSETFWSDIAGCAVNMQMLQEVEYCNRQILRNNTLVGVPIPKGMTKERISDEEFNTYIANNPKCK